MAKKRTRPARRPGGAEAHERRQARLDARREARARAVAAQRRAARRERIVRVAIIGLLAGGFLWFFLLQTQRDVPDSISGHRVEQFPESGAGQHVTGPVDYDSTPPTHGPHGTVVECGVHAEPIPNENQVHMLEHGAIGIQYRPDLDLADVRAIEDIVRSYDGRVFSAPYPDMRSAIAVTAWGELMRLDSLDADAIRGFVTELRGQGPEDVACAATAERPFRPPATNQGANGPG
jgi:hypothetical protein